MQFLFDQLIIIFTFKSKAVILVFLMYFMSSCKQSYMFVEYYSRQDEVCTCS